MFLRVWEKECKQIANSLIYWLYIIVLAIFFLSQLGSLKEEMIQKPEKGQESYADYGMKTSEDEQDIMRAALGNLAWGIWYDHFETYPVGFAKSVTLSDGEKAELEKILEETTGLKGDAVGDDVEKHFEEHDPEVDYAPYAAEPKE